MKRIFSMLLAGVILATSLFSFQLFASAESLYIRKIVSVVYDDSGSMKGEKWAYANYAMQTFCGMLNSEDQLYVTYMSRTIKVPDYNPEKIDLSAGGIQKSVDSIKNHTLSSSTPYAAVEKAYNKLKTVNDSNPNTQYWLVVITDGDFNEFVSKSADDKKKFLNEKFKNYTKAKMPNGTNPQVTFLGIGDVASPDEDPSKGIYEYSASDADEISEAMSEMADRISGRTRLAQSDIKKINDKTIQVSSTIPLLNIAVLAQESDAKITNAIHNNENTIPVSRKAMLNYPKYYDLKGGAYLLGDSQKVIGSGTYNITFDKNIDLDNIVILFEPALEMRMTISVNGKEISDSSELENVMEGDKVSVSCKIYEMGTDKEINPSLLPNGTRFNTSVSEAGKVVVQDSKKEMMLTDFSLKNIETEIKAQVIIEGFNPIEYSAKFTPTKYVPKVVYTLKPSFENNAKNIKLDNLKNNKDLSISFTVYADGIAVTDVNKVKELKPVIDVSPKGNDGSITYSADGKIVFTPNAAGAYDPNSGSFDVQVKCTLENGVTASETYTVLIATYKVVPIAAKQQIKKHKLFNNDVSVSFYITKDGKKLNKAAVEKHISVLLNEDHINLKTDITILNDGTITVTPYSDEEHTLNFWTWWSNWAYYFGLTGEDITVTLDHALGTADSTIDVIGANASYQILNVYLPLIIEIIILAFLITWIILIVTKPKYPKSATLFVGDIKYNGDNCTHMLRNLSPVKLNKFNKIKKGNGRLKFKKTADVVSANGIKIRADRGGRIICEMTFPWYKGKVEPVDTDFANLNNPAAVSEYISKHKKLEINEFVMTTTVNGEFERNITPTNPSRAKYFVVPDSGNGVGIVDEKKVIKSGKIFVYIN